MEGLLIPILGILSTIVLPVGCGMYLGLVSIRSKHTEDLELIKQGIVPASKPKAAPNRYRSLRNGFLCTGIGIGMTVGFVLSRLLEINTPLIILIIGAPILIFLGIAYILFYWVTKNKNLKE